MKPKPYFDLDEDEEPGFFGLINEIWADADKRRRRLKRKHGKALGDWLANIRQYGAAWWGDAYQDEARRIENHPAFLVIDDYDFWDHVPRGAIIWHYSFKPGETTAKGTARAVEYSIAGGKIRG